MSSYQQATGLRVFMFSLGAVYAKTAEEAMDFATEHKLFGREAIEAHGQLVQDSQRARISNRARDIRKAAQR